MILLMDLCIDGRICVVTGATRGIGAATARMLAQERARVLSVARHDAELELDVTDPDADWQEQWEVHVMASMRLMRAIAPAMAEAGGGRIVNVASSSGKRPSRRLDASYSVTKAAQLSLSRVFADAYAAEGVLVNAVAPGPVATPAWTGDGGLADQIARRRGGTRDEVLVDTGAGIPIGRMGREDEVAAGIP